MTKTISYGTNCPICKQFVPIGDVELPIGATQSDFQQSPTYTNWQLDKVTCSDPKCRTEMWCSQDDLLVPGLTD